MYTFPDLGSLSDQELKDLITAFTKEEAEVSYQRRILHGKIDILRAELVNRLRRKDEQGELVISGADVQQLTDILAGRIAPMDPGVGSLEVAQHCPECGFANDDGAAYCQRCGAFLAHTEPPPGVTTATYTVDESGDLEVVELQDVIAGGAALVIRAGGGREGESFPLARDRMSIGRSPESDVFLDDVTVSRDHALIVHRGSEYYLDDCGSLNGTYINRRRIESQRLNDGDELQIGKYKLAFLSR